MCPINTMRGTGESFPSIPLNSLQVDRVSGLYRFAVNKRCVGEIDSVFPISHFPDRSVAEDGDNLIVESTSADGVFFAQMAGWLNIGNVVLYGPLESKLYVTPLAACSILVFVLGML